MSAIGKKHNIHLNQQGKSIRNSIKYQMLKSNKHLHRNRSSYVMPGENEAGQDAIIKDI